MRKILVISLMVAVGLSIGLISYANCCKCCPKQLDFVNIGDPISEASHNLKGWGPIEPATHGGNWGGIGNDLAGADCDLPDGQSCDAACRVTYSGVEQDHPKTRAAKVTLKSKSYRQKALRIRALDGTANDDFMVFVKSKRGKWVLVYTYESDPSATETWKVHNIKLSPKGWFPKKNKPLEIVIMSTGDTWQHHSTYGQLGIDWIELVSAKKKCFMPTDGISFGF